MKVPHTDTMYSLLNSGPYLRVERCHVCHCLLWPIGPADPGCQHTCCHPDPYVRG